ncbi:tyrosine-type recombinase/integrase [Rhodovulum sp. YNF3179]|uniref:tyrosine-type recombinase/integrase n=1 Tax=Rhodovulum sp. YNF3179 TaxID=3425127 RepID=UPI003D326C2D
MPRLAKELTPLEVKRLEHPGGKNNKVFSVGGVKGLVLQITPSGARSWILRTNIAGKRRHIGLGGYPTVSLAQARERAREALDMIWRGVDPIAERNAALTQLKTAQQRGLTFKDAMERFLAAKLTEFRNEKHRKQWSSSLDRYAVPVIGHQLVEDIGVADVLRVLEPIWQTKTETASRLRGRIEAVLAWATVSGHREGDNPARWKGNLDAILPKPGKVAKVKHYPAVALADAADWFRDLQARTGTATRALEFMALTAARSGEVRGATWDEFDLDAGLWTIPADRMKAGKEHRVPLTAEGVEIINNMPRISEYVFAAPRGGQLSDMAISACMRRINEARAGGYLDPRDGRPAVPHGLRSTFRDWTAERTEYPRDMAEIALAHTVGSEVERTYRRTDMLEKRRQMMAAWQRFLRGEEGDTVVKLASLA